MEELREYWRCMDPLAVVADILLYNQYDGGVIVSGERSGVALRLMRCDASVDKFVFQFRGAFVRGWFAENRYC